MVGMDVTSTVDAGQTVDNRPVFDSYARLSKVPDSAELEKIVTQFEDNRTKIERTGARLGEELSDGMSAWKAGAVRPGWERLLWRARAGLSSGICVWHTDRLVRRPDDLMMLITMANDGFTVLSSHGTRRLDDPDDRFILWIEVAHAGRSSDDAQRRIKRRFEQMRKDGIQHKTGRMFGFAGLERLPRRRRARVVRTGADLNGAWRDELVVRESIERKPVSAELVARERAALVSGTRALLARVADADVAREWNKGGLTTVEGNEWIGTAVRDVLSRGRNAGLIEYRGEIVGEVAGEEDPIVAVDDFLRLRAMLKSRPTGTGPRMAYIASGIARCELCGHTLTGRPHTGAYPDGEKRRQYHCQKQRKGCGKVAADARAVDREIRGFVIRRLSDQRHAAALSAARARVADRLGEVENEIREIEGIQKQLSERVGRRTMSMDTFDAANEPLAADLARLRVEHEELTGGEDGGPVDAMTADQVREQWDAAEVSERRAMLASALGRDKLFIAPANGKGRGKFDPTRVKTPRAGYVA